jgi:ElaB/YqjD/DUF883 family membrane-anchored ribosome-binding protein
MKSHKEPTIYTLTDDDIDMIDYQVRDVVEEAAQQTSQKQEELHQKVQETVNNIATTIGGSKDSTRVKIQ